MRWNCNESVHRQNQGGVHKEVLDAHLPKNSPPPPTKKEKIVINIGQLSG